MVDAMVEHLDLFSTTRLASVCTSWSTAVATNAALPFGTRGGGRQRARGNDHEDWSYQLMNLTTERGDSFPALIRDVQEQWWVGGKDDWLAVVNACGGARLLNPYTGRQIDLPRIDARPCVIKTERAFDRIVVCATPSDDKGYLVIGMVNDNDDYLLAMARGGDESWTALRNPGGHLAGYKDAVVHKGKVFAVDRLGSIYAWDIQGGACTDPEVLQPRHVDRGELQQLQLESWKLAESADGRRLLLVCTYGEMANCSRSSVYGRFDYLVVGVKIRPKLKNYDLEQSLLPKL
uniref:KIB1-4 beta-propeller domain-containing protein n=1 Tax=Setaria viridis TaxID=4556 RepID=A0A4U6UNA8_SETVI|nr:hypothetical protein SEVIR_5G020900v2 [Setaria viridis]